jgi:hypothetical protein
VPETDEHNPLSGERTAGHLLGEIPEDVAGRNVSGESFIAIDVGYVALAP